MKNKNSILLSIGEPFLEANFQMALATFQDKTEAYIWRKTVKEIDDLRQYIGVEIPYKIDIAQSGRHMVSVYVEPSLLPKKEVPTGYAATAAAQKNAWYENKERYWQDKGEREEKRAEINDAEYKRRHYENFVQPFFVEFLKQELTNTDPKDRDIFLDRLINNAMTKAKELYDDK